MPTGGVIASLWGVSKYLKLRIICKVEGKRVSILANNGATHDFIEAQIVDQRGIQMETF